MTRVLLICHVYHLVLQMGEWKHTAGEVSYRVKCRLSPHLAGSSARRCLFGYRDASAPHLSPATLLYLSLCILQIGQDKGIQTNPDARFFSLTAPMDAEVSNEGKDLVVSYTVRHDQNLDCGGAYLKVCDTRHRLSCARMQGCYACAPMFADVCCTCAARQIDTWLARRNAGQAAAVFNNLTQRRCRHLSLQLMPPGFDAKKFGGDTPYSIMFGPGE